MDWYVKYGVLIGVLGLSGSFLLTLATWIVLGGYYTLYLAYHTLPRDIVVIKRFSVILWTNLRLKWKDENVIDLFIKTARRVPSKVMMTFCDEKSGDKTMTFKQCLDKALQVAHFFQSQGYKKGDIVSIFMENRLDYCCYWMGLSMIGVIPSLVNNNLRLQSLKHTLTIINSKAVIFSSETEEAMSEVSSELAGEVRMFCADVTRMKGATGLKEMLADQPTDIIKEKYSGYNDTMVYIYTSGTTGLPKAANVKHSRFLFAVYALFHGLVIKEEDVLYSALPMYHTAAGLMVTGCAATEGASTVARKKFSASQFWRDCALHRVTAAQYIGELARYLYATPVSPHESQHCLKMMFGNGMRPELWQKFVDRFKVPKICEYYGSTEGNCSISNMTGERVGAVGFISVLFPFILPLYIIKVDQDTGEPLRGPDGLAIQCGPGEPGEMVGRIDKGHPIRDFHGYTDNSSTSKKIMTDVFSKGDLYFRSGDILSKDEFGWVFFRDRAGDTFRWKGENVSTMEVETYVSEVLDHRDCVVFGVEIPGTEGRAGMAVVQEGDTPVDPEELYRKLSDKLPSYARPRFIRFVKELTKTGTQKLIKKKFQSESFNIEEITEEVLVMDDKIKSYKVLDKQMFSDIQSGNVKF